MRSSKKRIGPVRLWIAASLFAAAALLYVPLSGARAQNSSMVLPAVDRSTVTPTSSVFDITATTNASAQSATATPPADIPTLESLSTVVIPIQVDPTHTPGTPVSDKTLTVTPFLSVTSRPVSPTAASPGFTGMPTLTPTGTVPTPVPTLTPTSTVIASIPIEPAPLDVMIRSGSDPTRTVNLGEQIVFTIELKTRESLSGSLFITAAIPEGTDYVADSSMPLQLTSTTGAVMAPPPVADAVRRTLSWQVQPMSAGQKFVVSYAVQVNRATASIVASARAVNSQTGQASTSNAVVLPTQPLAVTLLRFETHPHPLGIKIVWQTGQEIETFGFVLLRSSGTDRASAMLITPKLIGAQGTGLGATYDYVDTEVSANQQYSYWLQEVEASGAVHDYGPLSGVAVGQSPQIVIAGSMVAGGVPMLVQVSGVDQKVVQTAQAVVQRNLDELTPVVNQVSQVAVQPVVSPIALPNTQPSEPTQAAPATAPAIVPTATPVPTTEASTPPKADAMPIATIEPATAVVEVAAVAINSVPGETGSNEVVASTSTTVAPEPTSENANANLVANAPVAAEAAVPPAPVSAQVVVPQVNVAAPNKSGDESRSETRWGPLNWLVAGLFACFGWLIVSSFLAVAVGRYLKGRQ